MSDQKTKELEDLIKQQQEEIARLKKKAKRQNWWNVWLTWK